MKLLTLNERLSEVRRLVNEGYGFLEAIEIVKGYEDSNQTIPSNQYKTIKDIITDTEDIDNGEVFDIKSGQTIRDLRGM